MNIALKKTLEHLRRCNARVGGFAVLCCGAVGNPAILGNGDSADYGAQLADGLNILLRHGWKYHSHIGNHMLFVRLRRRRKGS